MNIKIFLNAIKYLVAMAASSDALPPCGKKEVQQDY